MTSVLVRRARTGDAAAVRRVCLLTADAGGDASALHADPDLPGLVWAQPYLELEPAHAYVATVDDDVVGYVLGTPDTVAFEAAAEAVYWPGMRARHPLGPVAGRTPADEETVALAHRPPLSTGRHLAAYPGHLHLDLIPAAQGRGLGRRLLATVAGSLAQAGCGAAHVGVDPRNTTALGFYRHLGLVDLDASDDVVHLGLTLGNSARAGLV